MAEEIQEERQYDTSKNLLATKRNENVERILLNESQRSDIDPSNKMCLTESFR